MGPRTPVPRTRGIRVGPAGWSYPDWEGPVYPRPHPRGFSPLSFLARYVDLVELNTTFYRIPDPRVAARWAEQVRAHEGFAFVAKVYRGFTHEAWPADAPSRVRTFEAALEPLVEQGRLLALLAQFPVSFRAGATQLERLDRLASSLERVPLVLELRHRSWYQSEVLDRLGALGVGLAHLDLPASRDHPPPTVPLLGPVGYLRLHGRNAAAWFDRGAGRDARYDWLYAPADLEQIARRVREIAASGRETVLVTNNHYGGKALANALELKGLLEGRPPLAPATLREAFPRLCETTRGEGQQTLFG